MKTSIEREFLQCGRRHRPLYSDEEIALIPRQYDASLRQLGGAKSMIFDIVSHATGKTAGEIALRIGDSDSLYYLGHIGYHIDPPYRGGHWALRACRLCLPVFAALHVRSFVITTDTDNQPSIKTCERLGCTLESTVNVPRWCRDEFMISAVKRRYVYEIQSNDGFDT